jgi:formylglycine-generating enzyme required for sulfatase activity
MSAKDGEGNDDEVPHQVTLTKLFYIGRTEVTQGQWTALMGTNPSKHQKGSSLPVENLSWNEAMDFCEKLNSMGKAPRGWKFTLPTETQWEYAARGGNKSKGYKYSGSNNIDDVAWNKTSYYETYPVGKKMPNELGLYDMSGNVWEWCLDDWKNKSDMLSPEFSRGNDKNPSGATFRACRGGSCASSAMACRSATRDSIPFANGRGDQGFRLALVPESY